MHCAKGHDSTDTDFCSVCGTKMSVAVELQTCPDCSLARESDSGNFCEFCGYNFTTGASGALKPTKPANWEARVDIDPTLQTEQSPDPPVNFQPTAIRLTSESSLIGRRSEKRAIFPDISLDSDDAVSHRHALLNRQPNGGLVLRDLESANGTRLNGKDVPPLTDVAVRPGDQITLGHWTRITIQSTPETT